MGLVALDVLSRAWLKLAAGGGSPLLANPSDSMAFDVTVPVMLQFKNFSTDATASTLPWQLPPAHRGHA